MPSDIPKGTAGGVSGRAADEREWHGVSVEKRSLVFLSDILV